MKGLLIAASLAATPVWAATDAEQMKTDFSAAESVREFREWADKNIKELRQEFDGLNDRLDGYGSRTRRKMEGRANRLRERVTLLEGRLEDLGQKADDVSWRARRRIRDELRDIQGDLSRLEKKLDERRQDQDE